MVESSAPSIRRLAARGLVIAVLVTLSAAALSSEICRADRAARRMAQLLAARIDDELATNASPPSFRAALSEDGEIAPSHAALESAFATLRQAGGALEGRSRERARHRLRFGINGTESHDRFELLRFFERASVRVELEIAATPRAARLTKIRAEAQPPFPWFPLDPDGTGLDRAGEDEPRAVIGAVFRHEVETLRELEQLDPAPRAPREVHLVLHGRKLPRAALAELRRRDRLVFAPDPESPSGGEAHRLTLHSLSKIDPQTYRAGLSHQGEHLPGAASLLVKVVREQGQWRVQARLLLFVAEGVGAE